MNDKREFLRDATADEQTKKSCKYTYISDVIELPHHGWAIVTDDGSGSGTTEASAELIAAIKRWYP